MKVVKIGGAALGDSAWVAQFAAAVSAAREPLVIVHGGGPDITALSDRLGIEVRWHEGRRITPPEALDVAAMVLTGRVNKKLVGALLSAGVDAIGLCGIDGGLLRADIVEEGALGRVGRVTDVRTGLLAGLLQLGHTLVVSPISHGLDGEPLNVNADDAAAAIASSLGATELIFLTDVPGVRDGGLVRPLLGPADAASLIRCGVATAGMRVKLTAAVAALASGVAAVRIGDARVLYDTSAGTVVRSSSAAISLGVA
ncbi:MAG TPA: acetylglutamate kinase [Longimicrobiales bacterium]|nr:acetylglutamate kinase [Longimicrobiales bacterium]